MAIPHETRSLYVPDTESVDMQTSVEYREWLIVTEMVKRKIIHHNHETLSLCRSFTDVPFSPDTPHLFLDRIASIDTTIRTFSEKHPELSRYLTYPLGEEKDERMIERYILDRDIKLLALASEIIQTQSNVQMMKKDGVILLPSGTSITINPNKRDAIHTIMHPEQWEQRRQFHDRVFDVTIARCHYVLKEGRTIYHRGLMNHKHPRQTSVAEMQTAQDFVQRGTLLTNDILLTWEDPICAVEFPDGYSFVLFEKESDLLPREEAYELLKAAYVLLHPQDQLADIFVGNIQMEIDRLAENVILALGYEFDDYAQCLYRVRMIQNRLTLERFGFDFEFFRPMSKRDRKKMQKLIKRYDPQLYEYIQSRT